MNKYLIIYAHPNHEGHNGYFLETFTKKLKQESLSFEIIDLYAEKYEASLKADELYSAGKRNISKENKIIQEKIKNSTHLLFIYPTWWQNMPAILKGFFDRVFTSGFAFRYENALPLGLLKNKKAALFTTTGGPSIYEKLLIQTPSLKLAGKHILSFCGIKNRGFMLCSANNLEKNKKEIEKIADKILKYLD